MLRDGDVSTEAGQVHVITDASGNATFTFRPDRNVNLGLAITATATDPDGNTSEFSDPKTVT